MQNTDEIDWIFFGCAIYGPKMLYAKEMDQLQKQKWNIVQEVMR